MSVVATFHFVCLGWILFRSENFAAALSYLGGLVANDMPSVQATPFLLGLIAVSLAFQFVPERSGVPIARVFGWMPGPLLGIVVGAALVLIWAVAPEGVAPFIYFRF